MRFKTAASNDMLVMEKMLIKKSYVHSVYLELDKVSALSDLQRRLDGGRVWLYQLEFFSSYYINKHHLGSHSMSSTIEYCP